MANSNQIELVVTVEVDKASAEQGCVVSNRLAVRSSVVATTQAGEIQSWDHRE